MTNIILFAAIITLIIALVEITSLRKRLSKAEGAFKELLQTYKNELAKNN